MRNCRQALLITVFVGVCLPASGGEMAGMGAGTLTCAKFAQIFAGSPDSAEFEFYSWAQGFMSGWNIANVRAGQPMHDLNATSQTSQETYLRQYCDQHPLRGYVEGVMALFGSLPNTH